MFYLVGDWDDLQVDLHVSHDGFKIQFTGIVPVFLEFNGANKEPTNHDHFRSLFFNLFIYDFFLGSLLGFFWIHIFFIYLWQSISLFFP